MGYRKSKITEDEDVKILIKSLVSRFLADVSIDIMYYKDVLTKIDPTDFLILLISNITMNTFIGFSTAEMKSKVFEARLTDFLNCIRESVLKEHEEYKHKHEQH